MQSKVSSPVPGRRGRCAAVTAVVAVMFASMAVPASFALAQTAPANAAVASAAPMADGEIRKVDKAAGKLTIKHGEIKNLEMPPMTMVFQVRDKAMLDQVQQGDKIRFSVVEEKGKMVVTGIEPQR